MQAQNQASLCGETFIPLLEDADNRKQLHLEDKPSSKLTDWERCQLTIFFCLVAGGRRVSGIAWFTRTSRWRLTRTTGIWHHSPWQITPLQSETPTYTVTHSLGSMFICAASKRPTVCSERPKMEWLNSKCNFFSKTCLARLRGSQSIYGPCHRRPAVSIYTPICHDFPGSALMRWQKVGISADICVWWEAIGLTSWTKDPHVV